ncbi:MAG: sugar kinase [Rhizobiales bacterium]|nr:sugar kinase [Hyphomicrobiales bacterium]
MSSPLLPPHPRAIDILAVGEPMMEFAEVSREGERLYLPGHGGDTSNTVIAAQRSGAATAYFTALGKDAFGDDFFRLWQQEGVDCHAVLRREDASTGIYFITYGADGHQFNYWRKDSAASRITVADLPADLIARSRVLHVSGISQAISQTCADAVFEAIAQARKANTIVSYDTNLRLKLWPIERARAVTHAAMAKADIALPGLDDAQILTQRDTPEAICDFYLGLGCRIVALTLGKNGTMVATREERRLVPAFPVEAVDASGAGDTFDGAFLAEWLRIGDPFLAARYANGAAALATLGHGAVAPMPHRVKVENFIAERD